MNSNRNKDSQNKLNIEWNKYFSFFILICVLFSLVLSNYYSLKRIKALEETNLECQTKISNLENNQAVLKGTVEGMQESLAKLNSKYNASVDFLFTTDYNMNELKSDIHYIQEELQNIEDTLDNKGE